MVVVENGTCIEGENGRCVLKLHRPNFFFRDTFVEMHIFSYLYFNLLPGQSIKTGKPERIVAPLL